MAGWYTNAAGELSGTRRQTIAQTIHLTVPSEDSKVTGNSQRTDPTESLRQQQLLAPLRALRDPQSRLAWSVAQAQHRLPLPDDLRLDQFRVEGCLVRIWLVPEFANGVCTFRTDSDAVSLKALSGLLCDYYSGDSPEGIVRHPPEFLQQLGLLRHLAENRRATVVRIGEKIRDFAMMHLYPP